MNALVSTIDIRPHPALLAKPVYDMMGPSKEKRARI